MALSFRQIGIGIVAVAAIGAAGWQISRPEQVPVDMATLARGYMEVTVNADGKTRIRDVYEVSAPVSGQLLRSPVLVGDKVEQGKTVVARIEPGEPAFLDARSRRQAEAAVEQAEAAVALAATQITIAEKDLEDSQRQLNRLHDLHSRGTIPQSQLEQAELALDIAAAKLDSAHASYDMRLSELEAQKAVLIEPAAGDDTGATPGPDCCIELHAPVSGEVLDLVNESARPVTAGTTILSIGRMADLDIVVDLLSTDAVRIALGARAYVERWGGPDALEAKVRVIEPAAFTKVSALGIEEQRVRVALDFVTPEDQRPALGHNFRVYLRIVEWQGDDVLQVPVSALFRQDGDWAVFTVGKDEEGRDVASFATVEIGQRNTEMAEVLNGLAAGDVVITHPSDRISDGVLVLQRETG